jgi:hypothetical protein
MRSTCPPGLRSDGREAADLETVCSKWPSPSNQADRKAVGTTEYGYAVVDATNESSAGRSLAPGRRIGCKAGCRACSDYWRRSPGLTKSPSVHQPSRSF